jgi:hypothetical protein
MPAGKGLLLHLLLLFTKLLAAQGRNLLLKP